MLCPLVSLGIHLHPWPLQSISELKQIWHRSAVKAKEEVRNHSRRRVSVPEKELLGRRWEGSVILQGLGEEAEAYGWESLSSFPACFSHGRAAILFLLSPEETGPSTIPWKNITLLFYFWAAQKREEAGKELSPVAERESQEPRRKPYFYSCYFKAPRTWRKGNGCPHILTSPAAVAMAIRSHAMWRWGLAEDALAAGTAKPCCLPLTQGRHSVTL